MNKNSLLKEIIEIYIKSYNNFDVAGMLSNMHEDVVFENISDGKVDLSTQGINALREQAEQAKSYFSQREQRITSIRFNNDLVEIDLDYNAILAIDLPNGLRAGDKLELKGKSIFKFIDDKIIELKDIT
jgi:hypothetical protein